MVKFTAKSVTKIIRQGGTRFVTEDAPRGTGKLVLRVRETLAEWAFQYFYGGKRRLLKIGPAAGDGSLSLAEARERMAPLRRMLVDGLDPKAELERQDAEAKAKARVEASRGSVEQLFRAYVEDLKARGKSSWTSVENALLTGKHAAAEALGRDMKAAAVGPEHVRPVLRAAYERGPSMASHLRGYLNAAFKYGIGAEHDYTRDQQGVCFGLSVNPVASIPPDRAARKPGNRVLTPEEIRAAWFDMEMHGTMQQIQRVVRLLFAVGGQRVREVVEARVVEFDLAARVWTIPPERTKNDREHRVPLSDRAVELVQEIVEQGGGHPFLFPNRRGGERPMDFPSLNQAIRRLTDAKGTPRWTPRDIRRTCRTMLADAGEPDHRLDYHFNHGRSVGVGQKHYDRAARLAEKSVTMTAWDRVLSKVLGQKPGKVLPLAGNAAG